MASGCVTHQPPLWATWICTCKKAGAYLINPCKATRAGMEVRIQPSFPSLVLFFSSTWSAHQYTISTFFPFPNSSILNLPPPSPSSHTALPRLVQSHKFLHPHGDLPGSEGGATIIQPCFSTLLSWYKEHA